MIQVKCSYPTHPQHADQSGWNDGTLATADQPLTGLICGGCATYDAANPPATVVNQQAIRDALVTAEGYFGGNYTGWASMTNAQKDTAAKNAQRALAQIARWLLGDFSSAG